MHAHAYLAKSILQGAVNQFSLNWGGCLRLFSTLPKSNFALALIQRNAQCIRSILKQVEQQASCHVVNWDIILYDFHLFSCPFAHFLPCFSTHKGIYAPKKLLQYVNINRFRDGLKWMSFKGPFLWTTCSKSSCWFETCQCVRSQSWWLFRFISCLFNKFWVCLCAWTAKTEVRGTGCRIATSSNLKRRVC